MFLKDMLRPTGLHSEQPHHGKIGLNLACPEWGSKQPNISRI